MSLHTTPSGHPYPISDQSIDDLITSFPSAISFAYQPHQHDVSVSTLDQSASSVLAALQMVAVVNAPTSPVRRITEPPITYLNRGQMYTLRITPQASSLHLKTRMRLTWADEKNAVGNFQAILLTPGVPNPLEIDTTGSHGVDSVEVDGNQAGLTLLWHAQSGQPLVFGFKVNCLSTDFTTKGHGCAGAIFCLRLDTADLTTGTSLHACACHLKVFEGKGASRRLKQDLVKLQKLPADQFHESKEFTQLDELAVECAPDHHAHAQAISPFEFDAIFEELSLADPYLTHSAASSSASSIPLTVAPEVISHSTSKAEVSQWLVVNHFQGIAHQFENFDGRSMLQLTKADCIEICSVAEGIRLFNAIHFPPRHQSSNPTYMDTGTQTMDDST